MDNAYTLIQRALSARPSPAPFPKPRMDTDKWAAWQSAPEPDLPGYDMQFAFTPPDTSAEQPPVAPQPTIPQATSADTRPVPPNQSAAPVPRRTYALYNDIIKKHNSVFGRA